MVIRCAPLTKDLTWGKGGLRELKNRPGWKIKIMCAMALLPSLGADFLQWFKQIGQEPTDHGSFKVTDHVDLLLVAGCFL